MLWRKTNENCFRENPTSNMRLICYSCSADGVIGQGSNFSSATRAVAVIGIKIKRNVFLVFWLISAVLRCGFWSTSNCRWAFLPYYLRTQASNAFTALSVCFLARLDGYLNTQALLSLPANQRVVFNGSQYSKLLSYPGSLSFCL